VIYHLQKLFALMGAITRLNPTGQTRTHEAAWRSFWWGAKRVHESKQ